MSNLMHDVNHKPVTVLQERFIDFVEQHAAEGYPHSSSRTGKYALTELLDFPTDSVTFRASPGDSDEPCSHEIGFQYKKNPTVKVLHALGGTTLQDGEFWVDIGERELGEGRDSVKDSYDLYVERLLSRLHELEIAGKMLPLRPVERSRARDLDDLDFLE